VYVRRTQCRGHQKPRTRSPRELRQLRELVVFARKIPRSKERLQRTRLLLRREHRDRRCPHLGPGRHHVTSPSATPAPLTSASLLRRRELTLQASISQSTSSAPATCRFQVNNGSVNKCTPHLRESLLTADGISRGSILPPRRRHVDAFDRLDHTYSTGAACASASPSDEFDTVNIGLHRRAHEALRRIPRRRQRYLDFINESAKPTRFGQRVLRHATPATASRGPPRAGSTSWASRWHASGRLKYYR